MKFKDKDDKYLGIGNIGLITFLLIDDDKEYTIIEHFTFQEIFIYTLVFFLITNFIIMLTKLKREITISSLVLVFLFDFLIINHYIIEAEHYFTSKEIKVSGEVISLNEVQLKERFKDMTKNKIYDKFTIKTDFKILNEKQIYDTSYNLYHYIEINDKITVKGTLSKHSFKAEKFYFEDYEKQRYFGQLMKYR